jgi:hypothetical protein
MPVLLYCSLNKELSLYLHVYYCELLQSEYFVAANNFCRPQHFCRRQFFVAAYIFDCV